jgi:hypothetical protein
MSTYLIHMYLYIDFTYTLRVQCQPHLAHIDATIELKAIVPGDILVPVVVLLAIELRIYFLI